MEKDLFEPIKSYFENFGYSCDGEVGNIDLYMEKDGSSVAVELKQTLDFRAVQQAALRQKATDRVFIGIFRPKELHSKAFREKLYLLKRLGIGLITVSPRSLDVEIVSEPVISELSAYQKRGSKDRETLEEEFQRRKIRGNTGGVRGTVLMTAYREDALSVLDAVVSLGGEAGTAEIRQTSGVKNATAILYDNHYGWFTRAGRGRYTVSGEGLRAAEEFADTIKALRAAENKQ